MDDGRVHEMQRSHSLGNVEGNCYPLPPAQTYLAYLLVQQIK